MRDPRSALAETVSRIDLLLTDGRTRDDVLDLTDLSVQSGVPTEVIAVLLDGGEAPAQDISDRIIGRIVHLRETRLRPDGTRHSYEEIASSFGASRASLSNMVNGRKKDAAARPARSGGPLASTQAGIERFFFGEPTGWLSADPETALNDALQPILKQLRTAAGDTVGADRAVALRAAAALPADKWELLQGVIDTLEKQARAELAQE
ncbi:hypothetical protein [Streptomyces sp. NPDC127038]|uniref:hypothetical protein n=1 Tax=Streptomyces sp. NPDC127038 TaxID=3347114 RepID=UPI00365BCF52